MRASQLPSAALQDSSALAVQLGVASRRRGGSGGGQRRRRAVLRKSAELRSAFVAPPLPRRFLTDKGIEYLREYLGLPSDVVPATLKKSAK